MTTAITMESALRGLRWAVEQKGADYDPYSCAYVYFDKNEVARPDCIVGYALVHLGVPVHRMAHLAVKGANEIIITLYAPFLRPDFTFTTGAIRVLGVAQAVQDGRAGDDTTWGAALRNAESEAED